MNAQAFTFPSTPPPYTSQDFSTKKLVRSVRHFVQEELTLSLQNSHCLLAVSGGADSLALLCLWQWLRPVYNLSFTVLHINHHLRPQSIAEAHTVQALCTAWNIPCIVENISFEQKSGLEEAARHKRYALYEQHRQQSQAQWICLGHHRGDVQEDVLMRLMRGTGWPALGGMTAKDSDRHILRPLLLQDPQQLRKLLQYAGLSWAEDASNADTQYLRNRVRHNILPLLQAENPAFAEKISELWHFAQYDQDFWQERLHSLCAEHNIKIQAKSLTLPAKLLQKSDKATRLRLYHFALQQLQKHVHCEEAKGAQARAQTLFKLDTALQEGRGGTLFQFSGTLTATVRKGAVHFTFS